METTNSSRKNLETVMGIPEAYDKGMPETKTSKKDDKPKSPSIRTSLYLDPALFCDIKIHCANKRIRVNKFIVESIKASLQNELKP